MKSYQYLPLLTIPSLQTSELQKIPTIRPIFIQLPIFLHIARRQRSTRKADEAGLVNRTIPVPPSKQAESMANGHHRTTSIPIVRLAQALPPLPFNEISSQIPKPIQLPPYRDVSGEGEAEDSTPLTQESQPPGYEPMYDYLRSQQQQQPTVNLPQYNCPPETTQNTSEPPPQEPYRDEPFIVTIDSSQSPPPSYNELYDQNQQEIHRLIREFEMDRGPSEQSEEICKWVISMLIIALTVAAVGTAFNWGQPTCRWPNHC